MDDSSPSPELSLEAIAVTWVPLLVFVVLFAVGLFTLPFTWYRGVGLALGFGGLIPLTIARLQLGNSFSVTPQARKLVTHGIYSKVRHPIYIFGTPAIAGLIIFFGLFPALLNFGIAIPVQIIRARKEDAVLEAAFGEEYRAYRKTTWF